MFSIDAVLFWNFKSFEGEHDFRLPTAPGLYFLTGENKQEPKLGSNGAGKSTLLDAIYWCLTGRTLRGLKASDVVTWGQTSCWVRVKLTINGAYTSVTREQNPNRLTLVTGGWGQVVDQEALDKHLGLNANSFVYSVILPQFGQSFFELKPAEKLTLFSQIMGLDYWLERSDQAACEVSEIEKRQATLQHEMKTTQGIIASMEADAEEIIRHQNAFEKERELALTELEGKGNRLLNELEEVDKLKAKYASNLSLTKAELDKKQTDRNKVDDTRMLLEKRREKLTIEAEVIEHDVYDTRCSIDLISSVGATCSVCLQKVDKQHIKNEKIKLQSRMAQQKADHHTASKRLNELQKFVVKTHTDLAKLDVEVDDLTKVCDVLREKQIMVRERAKGMEAQAHTIKADLAAKQDEENPYTKMVLERRGKLQRLRLTFEEKEGKLAELNAQHAAYHYWVAGFKKIRLFVIEETLRSLELEVNNALGSLGLVGWSIEFDVERENKSGGVTKGFVVFIRCPANPEPVRWESWSGGETQRLQLAGDFGLANLIMMQAGLRNTIEFYDEPSDHLSDEGLIDLAETLQQRAVNEGKRILLVDHRLPEFGEFAGVYTVVKDTKGSHLELAE